MTNGSFCEFIVVKQALGKLFKIFESSAFITTDVYNSSKPWQCDQIGRAKSRRPAAIVLSDRGAEIASGTGRYS